MASSVDKIRTKSLFALTGDRPGNTNACESTLTVWSILQYEQFLTLFSHWLGQLQHHLHLVTIGQPLPRGSALLASTMVTEIRAMSNFLQRRYAMIQKLHGLGRVVETESSKTWYAQPETRWLRKALADLTARCDAFNLVASEICRAGEEVRSRAPSTRGLVPITVHKPASPVLRSYNSFSSIGSEAGLERGSKKCGPLAGTNASTPLTNPFSDGSSDYSAGLLATGQSSVDSGSPFGTSANSSRFPTNDDDCEQSDLSGHLDRFLPSALQGLLELSLGRA